MAKWGEPDALNHGQTNAHDAWVRRQPPVPSVGGPRQCFGQQRRV